jgi:hypothetical protein
MRLWGGKHKREKVVEMANDFLMVYSMNKNHEKVRLLIMFMAVTTGLSESSIVQNIRQLAAG